MNQPLPTGSFLVARLGWLLLVALLSLSVSPVLAQRYTPPGCKAPAGCNLLSNPSFEQLKFGVLPGLPGGFGNRNQPGHPDSALLVPPTLESLVCGWHAGNRAASPNLFHRYDSLGYFISGGVRLTVPDNYATTRRHPQDSHSGDAYGGIIAAEDTTHFLIPNVGNPIINFRQYLAQDVTLTAGKVYYAEFYTAVGPGSKWAVPDLGLGFNPSPLRYLSNGPMPFPAAINGVLNDTLKGWQHVGGTFTATGLEKQLVIGYYGPPIRKSPYFSPLLPGPAYQNPNSAVRNKAYYFIDDVLLVPMTTAADTPTLAICGPTQLGTCPLPASAGATYSWAPATGLSNPNSANPTVLPGVPGKFVTYTLTVTVPTSASSNFAQTYTSTVRVSTVSEVSVRADDTDACSGRGTVLTASGGDGSTFTWSPPLGLSATTGSSVLATPSSSTTYTVTSSCGGHATIDVAVGTTCCLLEQHEVQEAGVVAVGGSYNQFAGSPFDAPAGTYFHATTDVYLTGDLFVLRKGSTLLFDAGVRLHLDDGGRLEVEGATLTAACHDMWGGVYVHANAGGIRFTGPGGQHSQLRHSYEGVVVEEKSNPAAYFEFTHTDFAHNRRSLTLQRYDSQTLPTDALSSCTFTSDPQYFKAPWDLQSGPAHYSELHVLLHGDFRDVPLTACYFGPGLVGVHTLLPYGAAGWSTGSAGRVSNCTFDNFQVAGLVAFGDKNTSLYTPAGEPAAWDWQLRGNTFHFPAQGLIDYNTYVAADYDLYHSLLPHSAYPYASGVVSDNNGLQTELTSNRFAQLHSDTASWSSYAQLRHVGVMGGDYSVERLEDNAFYQLRVGVWNLGFRPAGPMALLRNVFRNCATGVELGDHRFLPTAPGAVELSCNSYVRADGGGRSGQPVGLGVYMDGVTLSNAQDTTTSQGLLKDYFVEKPGSAPMITLAHYGGQLLRYKTFDNYKIAIGNRAQGANIDVYGPGSGSSTLAVNSRSGAGGNVCANDGFADTGIQLRSASPVAIPSAPLSVTKKVSPVSLAQNWPNPADATTHIAYELPAGCHHATLLVREGVSGRVARQLSLDPAAGVLTLDVRALPAGLYFYSLLADGVPVLTRRLLIDHL